MTKAACVYAASGGRPAVILGRSQRRLQVQPVLPVRQRFSGGGVVLGGPWMLRAAIRLPRDHPLLRRGPAAAARWFGELHLRWLHQRGLSWATLYEGPLQDHWACFAGRGPGEVLVDGRKLVGIAQAWKRHGALLSSGTLLQAPPWPLLCEALQRPAGDAAELAARTIGLQECLGRQVDAAAWTSSLRSTLAAALPGDAPAASTLNVAAQAA